MFEQDVPYVLWKRTFKRNDDLSTTCQCQQLKLNPLSTQIKIYCLMTNQTPELLVQRAPWTRAAVMLLQSLIFLASSQTTPRSLSCFEIQARWPLVTQSARSRRSYGKIGDCEKSSAQRSTMSKKIWLSMHTRKFGNNVTVRVPSAPQVYQCEITQSTGIATQMQH